MNDFELHGQYRMQSRRDHAASLLAGNWFVAQGVLENEELNLGLSCHPQWNSRNARARVSMRPALVTQRCGKFSQEPDVLYKRDLFIPDADSPAMHYDIVDILKSREKWQQREGLIAGMVGQQQLGQINSLLGELELAIANEYLLHEAGHLLAYDIYSKQEDGYFAPYGKTAWPLIYLEELRADLNAFGFALLHLPDDKATAVFMYNILQRFGVHKEGLNPAQHAPAVASEAALSSPYGLVPYLLFCLLHDIGCITVQQERGKATEKAEKHDDQAQEKRPACQLCFSSLQTGHLISFMRACSEHAQVWLNQSGGHTIDCALHAAGYIRARLQQQEQRAMFSRLMASQLPDISLQPMARQASM